MSTNVRKWIDWVLVTLAAVLAVAANFPAIVPQQLGISQQYLIGMLFALLLFALLKYVRIALVVTVFLLTIGANLPEAIADQLGMDVNILFTTLIALVVVGLLNNVLHFVPIGAATVKPAENPGAQTLFNAIKSGDVGEVDRLLRAGVSANVRSGTNDTPLMAAVTMGYANIVRLLLRSGADVGARNDAGKTALALANGRGDHTIINDLVNAGALE